MIIRPRALSIPGKSAFQVVRLREEGSLIICHPINSLGDGLAP